MLEISLLGEISRRFLSALVARYPTFLEYSTMVEQSEPDGLSLSICIPSPTGDEGRAVYIWVDESVTPSVGFGPGHTHCEADDLGIVQAIALVGAVLSDHILVATDMGGKFDGHSAWLDLRDPLALISELTSPYSPGSLRLTSYSGAADRLISLSDLDA